MSLTNRNTQIFFPNCFVFILLIVIGLAGKANGAGALDSTFGAGGKAYTRVGSTSIGNDLAVQTDGKIVVVGYTPFTGGGTAVDFAVARFNTNGTLDTTFGSSGKVITQVGAELDIAKAVVIEADGKIVVGGVTATGTRNDFALVRYNADGSVDTAFGTGGKVVTTIGNSSNSIQSVIVQPDGKIIAVGEAVIGSSRYFGVARYNSNGSLDTSFDGDGKLTAYVRSDFGNDTAYTVALQPDGKILVGGDSFWDAAQHYDYGLIRLNPNGSLDSSFDTDGRVITQLSPTSMSDRIIDIAVQPDGKIVAVGTVQNAFFNDDSIVVRYNANGSLDTTFDSDGKVYISFGNLIEALLDVEIQPNGKIVVGGYKSNNSGSPTIEDLTLARLNTNGSLDTTFDGDGKTIIQYTPYNGRADAVKIQPNGKIVAGGSIYASNGDAEFMVSRFMGDAKILDFDGDAKTDVSIFRPSNGQWWYLRSSDGGNNAFQFGVSTDKPVPADYTGDGKTDIAVYRPSSGEWFVLRSEDFSFYAFPFGISTDVPVQGDYDGDGKADAAVLRSSTATWYINNSSNGGTIATIFGVSGDRPVPADYDGDGKTDIAIYRQTGGNSPWWIRRSSDGGVFTVITPTANAPSLPGDYTGDGKADFAYFIGANVGWYITRSEDLTTYLVQFGQTGDVLTPGDYDGDGKFDIAIFRPSNNTWRIRRSTDNSIVEHIFGTMGDFPLPSLTVRQ